jgi:membrane-bound lytic murein transglycosylase B
MMLSHTIAMNQSSRKAALAAFVALSILVPTTAFAEPTPAPTTESPRTPFEQYRLDFNEYLEAIKVRSQQIRVINAVFKDSCDKAARDFKAAMSVARTPGQKNYAATARKNAVSDAIIARDFAITELGAEPVPPVEPAKPLKVASKKKSR